MRRLIGTGVVGVVLCLSSVAHAADPPAPGAPVVPAETGPVTFMECADSATDINHSSAQTLATRLGLPLPVAGRIVEQRPYLHVRELGAVAGIGPPKLAQILANGRACATPYSLPPPAPNPCSADDQVDLNDPADRAQAAAVFGRPTADRIYGSEYGPYLAVANATRVPGVGAGHLRQLGNRVCAEPTPVEHAGVRWTFVDGLGGEGELLVGPRRYALTVPPGVIGSATGSWTSIDEVDDPYHLGAPAADFHIHGAWDGYVHLTLPPDTAVGDEPPEGWTDVVVHMNAGATDLADADVHTGPNVATNPDGSSTVAVDDLSISFDIRTPVRWVATEIVKGRQLVDRLWRGIFESGAPRPTCHPDISDSQFELERVFDDGRVIGTAGEHVDRLWPSPTVWYCVQEQPGDTERWRLAINRLVAFDVHESQSADVVSVGTAGGIFAALGYLGYNRAALGDGEGGVKPAALPGGDLAVDVAPTLGRIELKPSVGHTLMFAALTTVSDVVPAVLGPVGGILWDQLVNCPTALTLWGTGVRDGQQSADAAIAFLTTLETCMQRLLAPGVKELLGLSDGGREFLERARRAVLWLRVAGASNAVYDATEQLLTMDDGVEFTNRPAPPEPPPGGGAGQLPGGGLDGTLPPGSISDIVVKRDDGYHAELTTGGDKIGHAILTVDAYACITRRYLVRDRVRSVDYSKYVLANSIHTATCPRSRPERTLPSGSRNFIMRELNNTAWFLDATGHVRWIESGGVYDCLAQRYFVIDNRNWDEITSFPWAPDGEHASCP